MNGVAWMSPGFESAHCFNGVGAHETRRRKQPCHFPILRWQNKRARAYFVTMCTHQRKAILASPDAHALIDSAFREVRGWWISQYLIMPDHIHFVCHPLSTSMEESHGTVPVHLSQLITFVKARISLRWPRPVEQPIWQRDFWDTEIRSERHHQSRWNYIRGNPVRKGFVKEPEEWPFVGGFWPERIPDQRFE